MISEQCRDADENPHSRSLRALEWGTLVRIFEIGGKVTRATSQTAAHAASSFFAHRPGAEISLGDDPADALAFIGMESCNDTPCLHFMRNVRAGKAQAAVPDTAEPSRV